MRAPFHPEALLEAMTLDKKALKGKPRFVIIDAIGSCLPFGGQYCTPVEESLVREAAGLITMGREIKSAVVPNN